MVLEAAYGWYWAADVLADAGAHVHLAHPPPATRQLRELVRHRAKLVAWRSAVESPGARDHGQTGPTPAGHPCVRGAGPRVATRRCWTALTGPEPTARAA